MRFSRAKSARPAVLGLLIASPIALGSCGIFPPDESGALPPPAETSQPEEAVATTSGNRPDMIKSGFTASIALPSVVTIVPAENASSVSTGTNIHATYDGSMPASSAEIRVFIAATGASVSGSTTFDPNANTIHFDPFDALPPNTKIRVEAPGHQWFFTTGG